MATETQPERRGYIQLSLPRSLLEALRRTAREDTRSTSRQAEVLLRLGLERREEERQKSGESTR